MKPTKRTTSPPPSSPERLARYEQLVATIPGLERKGATLPYTSRNGHMFSFLTKEGGLALRLPDDARQAFMAQHRAALVVQHGAVMKEYVAVPDALLERPEVLAELFATSHAYVGSLRPKPTTKKKTAKKKAAKKKA
jgi:hypothetical protein